MIELILLITNNSLSMSLFILASTTFQSRNVYMNCAGSTKLFGNHFETTSMFSNHLNLLKRFHALFLSVFIIGG